MSKTFFHSSDFILFVMISAPCRLLLSLYYQTWLKKSMLLCFYLNVIWSLRRFFFAGASMARLARYSRAGSRYSSGIVGGKGFRLKIHLPVRGSRAIARPSVELSCTSLRVGVVILFGASNCAHVSIMTRTTGRRVSLATCRMSSLRQIWSASLSTISSLISCNSCMFSSFLPPLKS